MDIFLSKIKEYSMLRRKKRKKKNKNRSNILLAEIKAILLVLVVRFWYKRVSYSWDISRLSLFWIKPRTYFSDCRVFAYSDPDSKARERTLRRGIYWNLEARAPPMAWGPAVAKKAKRGFCLDWVGNVVTWTLQRRSVQKRVVA